MQTRYNLQQMSTLKAEANDITDAEKSHSGRKTDNS